MLHAVNWTTFDQAVNWFPFSRSLAQVGSARFHGLGVLTNVARCASWGLMFERKGDATRSSNFSSSPEMDFWP
jgi:hypothetical protein